MAWRRLTEDDLIASLARDEVELYRASSNFESDPIRLLLDRTAAFVRTYLATNGNIRMSPDDHEIPEATISPAMDYLVVDVLKRIDTPPSDARRDARREAKQYFESIASGKLTVESYGSAGNEQTGGPAVEIVTSSRHRTDAHRIEGL